MAAAPIWLCITEETFTRLGIDYVRALSGTPYSFATVVDNGTNKAGIMMPRETVEMVFEWDTMMSQMGSVTTLDSGETTIPVDAQIILSEGSLTAWRAQLDTLDRDTYGAALIANLEASYQRALSVRQGTNVVNTAANTNITMPVEAVDPYAQDGTQVDDPYMDDPVVVEPSSDFATFENVPVWAYTNTGRVIPIAKVFKKETIVLQIDGSTVITDIDIAIKCLTSFMGVSGLPMMRYYDGKRVFMIRGKYGKNTFTDTHPYFMVLVPCNYQETTASVDYAIGSTKIKGYNKVDIGSSETDEVVDANVKGTFIGSAFRMEHDGIVLYYGSPDGWDDVASREFFTKHLDAMVTAHASVFPVWTEGDISIPLRAIQQSAVTAERNTVLAKLEDTKLSIEQLANKVVEEKTRISYYEEEIKRIDDCLKGDDRWVREQIDILRSQPLIETIKISNNSSMFMITTVPITYRTAHFEFLFGRYQIMVNTKDSSFPREMKLPLYITNVTRGKGTYQHPHGNSDGSNWCWSTTANYLSLSWNSGDIIGTINALLIFLRQVTLNDSFAAHLAYFDRRELDASGRPVGSFVAATGKDNRWPNIQEEIKATIAKK